MCSLHCMCSPRGCWDYWGEYIVMHLHIECCSYGVVPCACCIVWCLLLFVHALPFVISHFLKYFVCIIVHTYAKGSTSTHQNVGCCWWKQFLQKQSDTGLVKLCSKDLPNCSLFSAAPGPPTRGVESRSSPQAPCVGSSVPNLPGTCRVPGESFL